MPTEIKGEERLALELDSYAQSLSPVPPRKIPDIMLAAAQARTPVRTGKLRASGIVLEGAIQFTVPYAAPIHWGWRARGISPQPFLTQGIEASQPQWTAAYEKGLQSDLDRINGASGG
jgi:hypothetical protein